MSQRSNLDLQEDDIFIYQGESSSLLNKHFVVDSAFTINAKIKNQTILTKIHQQFFYKNNVISNNSLIRFYIPLFASQSVYASIDQGTAKLRFDSGYWDFRDTAINLFGSIAIDKDRALTSKGLQLGFNSKSSNSSLDFRLKYATDRLVIDSKHIHKSLNNSFACLWSYNAFKKVFTNQLTQFGLFNAAKDHSLFFRYRQTLQVDYVHRYAADAKAVVSASFDKSWKIREVTAVIEEQLKDMILKAKISSENKFNFSIQREIASYGSYLFGVAVKDIGGLNQFSYGIRLDLNL